MKTRTLLLGAWALAAAGCVSTGKYDAALADAAQARAELETTRRDAHHSEQAAREQSARDESELSAARSEKQSCQKSLDDATALHQQLEGELKRRGADTDKLLSVKGVLAASLEQARGRLDELRRAEAAAQARSAKNRRIEITLQPNIDEFVAVPAQEGG
jgi:septal ring factor EnvC (AmiA/AmiB activator)